jgi:hypothetical protein
LCGDARVDRGPPYVLEYVQKQGDVSHLSNADIKNRYCGLLNRDIFKTLPLPNCHVHTLRSV